MGNKKKLLFFMWSFSLGGGAEKILATIVNQLDPKKYDIDILEMEHFDKTIEWWNNRVDIEEDGSFKAKKYDVDELINRNYNFNLCGYPHEEEIILPPKELMAEYHEKRLELNDRIDNVLNDISKLLGIEVE